MVKRHLKTLTVPVTWPIKRKGKKFVLRPNPGKLFSQSIPLSLIFKDILKYCKTSNEVKTILKDKEVLVDGKRRKDPKYLVGLMDVLSLPLLNESFRITLNKNNKIELVAIQPEEANQKICKINGKTILKKGKVQLNLSDGRNILVKEDKYSIGDSILIKLPTQEILDEYKLEKGHYALLTEGTHVGYQGVIETISKGLIQIKAKEGVFETPKQSVFVIGKSHKNA
jgi:small subunit ribosomal protein S4e